MNNFYIDYIGCEKRKLDAEKIIQYMLANQYEHKTNLKDIEDSSILFLVSCAFNSEFSDLSKQKIKRILENKNEESIFILSGCLPEIEPEYLEKNNIQYAFGPRNLDNLDLILDHKVKMKEIPEQNLSYFDNIEYPVPNPRHRSRILEEYVKAKNEYKIRVCWGCKNNCTYCVIKRSTKDLKSKSLEEIEKEMRKGIDLGHDKFFFTGGDLGSYGADIGTNVVDLLKLITSFNNISIYMQEFNVQWIIKFKDEIHTVLLENKNKYCKIVINTPIQSGSNKILTKMNRLYEKHSIIDAIKKMRYNNHKIFFGSHFIVGFPGESNEDYEETKDLVNKLNLDFIMVFAYSEHLKSKSATFNDKIDQLTKEKRFNDLMEVQYLKDVQNNRMADMNNLSIESIHQMAEDIDGWLTPAEGEVLFNTAKNLFAGNIVEIGSWKGKSTFYLACGLLQRGKGYIYSVDHHNGSFEQRKRTNQPIDTLNTFSENMRTKNVSYIIKTLVMDSITASKNVNDEIGLVFIDGSHDYESIKSDFEAWWPKVQVGGIIAFHDYISKDGVGKFVDEIMYSRLDIEFLNIMHELILFKKSEDNIPVSENQINEIKNYKTKILGRLKNGGNQHVSNNT